MDNTVPDFEFYQVLGRLEGAVKAIDEKLSIYLERGDKLEERVRALENWRWKVIGIASVVSMVLSAGVALIARLHG